MDESKPIKVYELRFALGIGTTDRWERIRAEWFVVEGGWWQFYRGGELVAMVDRESVDLLRVFPDDEAA